jgi:1-aminocyclopropane-1-carboxylate deaminase/D-cysteine desulfhydrase-like pyridoxal-dependent ACC family enzyme
LAQAGVLAEVSQLPRDLVSACQVRGESFAGVVEAGDRRFVVAARPLSVSSEVVGVLVCGVSASDANGTLMGLSSIESDILALASDAQTEKQRSVADFIKIIRGIAKRIHLLALNASILSAQAGEHGRGFAVVAREIGELAERTRQSTQELEADFLGQKREIVVERRQGGRQR